MSTHLVTFASEDYSRSADLCIESAKRNGIDEASIVIPKEPCNERGYGFWRWKPQIILSRMNLTEDDFLPVLANDDILIYTDAGVEFINNVSHIIDRMDQDIFLFGNNWEHAHWCKRDVIETVWPDHPVLKHALPETLLTEQNMDHWVAFGKQVQASVIFCRVSDYTHKFVKEWLRWCLFEGGRLIDDSPSRAPNHPEFREHRHDQAILTTLAYREGIKLHYWPAVYNDGAFTYEKLLCYAGDNYPILFHHHRRRNND